MKAAIFKDHLEYPWELDQQHPSPGLQEAPGRQTAMKAAIFKDHLEYPWELDPHTTPRRWETRRDQDGQTYSYAQFFRYYWNLDTWTRQDLDDYWETLPRINSAEEAAMSKEAVAEEAGDMASQAVGVRAEDELNRKISRWAPALSGPAMAAYISEKTGDAYVYVGTPEPPSFGGRSSQAEIDVVEATENDRALPALQTASPGMKTKGMKMKAMNKGMMTKGMMKSKIRVLTKKVQDLTERVAMLEFFTRDMRAQQIEAALELFDNMPSSSRRRSSSGPGLS